MKSNLLIVIDMLNDFIDPEGVLYCGETAQAIVPYVQDRLKTFRRNGDPVIFVQDAHTPEDKEFEKFPPHCVVGTWGSEIIKVLAPLPEEQVVSKKRYNGFYGTTLDRILQEIRPAIVEVVGVCTSICVMDTVGGLVNRDYAVRVPRCGVADFDQHAHSAALQRMEKIYGAKIV
jgi:nicotinamidase-related amidase